MSMTITSRSDWQFAARPLPAELFYWAGVPLLMALHLGWHHAGAASLAQRTAERGYFSGLARMGWGSLILCTHALYRVLSPLRPRPWVLWLGGALLALLVLGYPKMVYIRLSDLFLTAPYSGTSGPFLSWQHLTQAVANAPPGIIAWMFVNAFYDRVLRLPRFHYPPVDEGSPKMPAFLQGLDQAVGPEDVLALEACDHYLRIHTAGRTSMVYYRFGDAIAQISRQPGMQVHRSNWVAVGAMKGLEKHKHGYQLELANGARVPVSRTHLKDVMRLLKLRCDQLSRRYQA